MPHILVIEDDPSVRTSLLHALTSAGLAGSSAATGMSGLQGLVDGRPDLVLLDLGLPDINGVDLLRMIRAVDQVAVIVATAQDQEERMVAALDAGADDYIVKPFGANQLTARIRAVLRRRTGGAEPSESELAVGGLVVSVPQRRAALDGRVLDLSPKEFDMLVHLAKRPGHVISRRELLAEVWHLSGTDKTLDVHLSWLRAKMGESARSPRYVHTVRGVGIRLAPPGA